MRKGGSSGDLPAGRRCSLLEKAINYYLVFLAGIAFGYLWAIKAYGVLN